MCGSMPPQVVGPQMDTHQLACLVNDCSCSLIGQFKDLLIRLNAFFFSIGLQTISDFLGDKDDLGLLTTFGISEDEFPAINIPGTKLEHLADSHPAAGHEFQQQAVSRFHGPEDDLVDDFLFENRPMGDFGRPEKLPEHRGAAGVFNTGIDSVFD